MYCSVDYSVVYSVVMQYNVVHLCFKQAQPKMCHSPKVDDGVE